MIGYPPPSGGRTVRGESLGGPGSIPGMECLRSITPLAHRIGRAQALSTGRRIGLSSITTWSRVRLPPPEPNAGVAQG